MKFADLTTETIYYTKTSQVVVVLDASTFYQLNKPYRFAPQGQRIGFTDKITSRRYSHSHDDSNSQGVLVIQGHVDDLHNALSNKESFQAFVRRVTSGEKFDWDEVIPYYLGESCNVNLRVVNPVTIEGTPEQIEERRRIAREERLQSEQAQRERDAARQARQERIKSALAERGITADIRLSASPYSPEVTISADDLEALLEIKP